MTVYNFDQVPIIVEHFKFRERELYEFYRNFYPKLPSFEIATRIDKEFKELPEHKWVTVVCKNCGFFFKYPVNCGMRLCPICSRRQRKRAREKMRAQFIGREEMIRNGELAHITFTIASNFDLGAQRLKLHASRAKLKNRKVNWCTGCDREWQGTWSYNDLYDSIKSDYAAWRKKWEKAKERWRRVREKIGTLKEEAKAEWDKAKREAQNRLAAIGRKRGEREKKLREIVRFNLKFAKQKWEGEKEELRRIEREARRAYKLAKRDWEIARDSWQWVKENFPPKERRLVCAKCYFPSKDRPYFKDVIRGGTRCGETTFNPEEGWHYHIHECDEILAIDAVKLKRRLKMAWEEITLDSHQVDVRLIYDIDTLQKYITSYLAAPVEYLNWGEERCKEYECVMKRKRFYQTFGTFYTRKEDKVCAHCEASMSCHACGAKELNLCGAFNGSWNWLDITKGVKRRYWSLCKKKKLCGEIKREGRCFKNKECPVCKKRNFKLLEFDCDTQFELISKYPIWKVIESDREDEYKKLRNFTKGKYIVPLIYFIARNLTWCTGDLKLVREFVDRMKKRYVIDEWGFFDYLDDYGIRCDCDVLKVVTLGSEVWE